MLIFFIHNIDNNNHTDSDSNNVPLVMVQNINAEKKNLLK